MAVQTLVSRVLLGLRKRVRSSSNPYSFCALALIRLAHLSFLFISSYFAYVQILSTADYIAGEMKRIGLLPLGDIEGTSYFNVVPNSVSEQFCPQGMRNIIGMIPGTDPTLNDEYVIFSAHHDGPNNENPQTQTTR